MYTMRAARALRSLPPLQGGHRDGKATTPPEERGVDGGMSGASGSTMAGQANWANQTIWTADNLDVMRGMNSASVDLIYLDPPFNSKANYAAPIGSKAAGAAFKDTWTLTDVDVEWINLIEAKHPALYRVLLAAMTPSDKSYLAYMAVRLLEMHRLLSSAGSVYLHCDPTMSHHLKLVMDAVFGPRNFRTEIVWKRSAAHSDTRQGRKQHGRIHDTILFYTKGARWTWNPQYLPYEEEYIGNAYRHVEEGTGRRYRWGDLTAAKPGGNTSYEWRVKRPIGGGWEADVDDEYRTPQSGWEYKGVPPYNGRYWAYATEGMLEYERQGRLVYARTGMPNYKRYLDEMPGVPLQDLWTDLSPAAGKERLGYPTQKPLALLDRIISASSDPGDMVLDPFCGCATACIAAEQLNRQWVGIDVSSKAAELVQARMEREVRLFYQGAHRTDVPSRTDLGKLARYNDPGNKRLLYGNRAGTARGVGRTSSFGISRSITSSLEPRGGRITSRTFSCSAAPATASRVTVGWSTCAPSFKSR